MIEVQTDVEPGWPSELLCVECESQSQVMIFDQLAITQKGLSTVGLEDECKSSLSKLAVVEPVETTFDSSTVIF